MRRREPIAPPARRRPSRLGPALALLVWLVAAAPGLAAAPDFPAAAGLAAAAGAGGGDGADRHLDAVVASHPAFGPALAYRSAATDATERALSAAEEDLRRAQHGLSAVLSYRPSVSWRATGDAVALGAAAWRGDLTAAFGWRADAEAIVRARLALHRATVAHGERVNGDLRDALTRHIDLQRALIARTIAEDAAATRSATLAIAERVDLPALAAASDDPPPPEPRTLLASRLEAERGLAAVDRAAREVAEAERRAVAAGFDPRTAANLHRDRLSPLALEGWRLWLPEADPLAAPGVTRAALDLAAAEAAARRGEVGGWLDAVRIELVRTETEARLRANAGLDQGRPYAALDLTARPAARASWSLALSAVLRLDDRLGRDRERAASALADAAAAWGAAADEAAWALERARRTALDAEEDVAFGERGLALARLGLREALATWHERDREDASARDRADATLARAAIALERERDAFYRAWNRYLLEAERSWSTAGVTGGVIAPP